jgi:hypothetical protein
MAGYPIEDGPSNRASVPQNLFVLGLQDCSPGRGPLRRNLGCIDRHKSRRYIMPRGQGVVAQIVEELLLQNPFSKSGFTLLTIREGYLRRVCDSQQCGGEAMRTVITDGATEGL